MPLALTLIVIALAGVVAIELNETYRLRKMMDERIETLMRHNH